ncbi:MAG TPA: hypothetical protein EYO58_06960, partial [Flavobacteriales bacterium]|nr:hypothetical protein [Flavobacteriales bacterium]
DGSLWNQVGQDIDGIYTSAASREFLGASVSLNSSGTIVAIGVPYAHTGPTPPGKTRVYQFNGNSWVQLGNDIIGGITSDRFGCSVSISSDGYTVAIGAHLNDAGAPDDKGPGSSPKVRIFHWGGSSWVQVGADIDSYLSSFGESVSLSKDGNRVAIGSSGFIVSVYENNGGWTQLGQDIYTISTSVSVSINAIGDKLAIGCRTDQGFIYEYNTCGITNSWIQIGEIVGGYSLGGVGSLISISDGGDTVAIGSPGGNTGGSLARVYSYQCQLVLSATDICTGPSPTTGINTGSIDLSVTGGTGNYAYNWSNGATTEDISGLLDGVYTVIVTDLNDSCNCIADTLSVTINCPDSCILNVSATDTCILDATTGITTGSISVSVSGGSGNYNYTWLSFTGNPTGPTITGLPNATYTVMVEDNINTTCQNASLSVTIACDTCIYGCTDPLAVNYNQFATCDDNTCFLPPLCVLNVTATDTCILDSATGITTGSISVSVSGGSGNYNYTWLSFTGNPTGPTITGLPNATYTVMVEDNINTTCQNASLSVTIACDTCIYGCTDPLAANYNPNATCDDDSCIYPCDSITDPGFENITTINEIAYFDDWGWSHGTPSVSTPFTGNYGVMMWSATLPQGGEGGEGLFTCFDFDTTKCYDISFWAKVNDTSLNATFDLFATSDLTQQSQNYPAGGPIPSVVSEPIGSVPFSNIGTNWTYIEIPVYQPNGNNNQFWFYPNHPNSLIAAKIWVDEVHITEVSCDTCNIILSATDSCILDTVSGTYSGSIDLTVSGGSCYTYSWTGPGGPYTTEDLTGLADGTYCVTVYDCIDT